MPKLIHSDQTGFIKGRYNDKTVADDFNNFFASVGKSTNSKIESLAEEHIFVHTPSLERVDWENLDKSDANSAYESFVNIFSEVYDKNISTKTIQLKYRVQKSCRNP